MQQHLQPENDVETLVVVHGGTNWCGMMMAQAAVRDAAPSGIKALAYEA